MYSTHIYRSNNSGWSIFNEATEIEVIGNIYENPELL
ncbi:YopX family protein, partial [Bacillus sp. SS-TM]